MSLFTLLVELYLGGAWVDITSKRRQQTDIVITRGAGDEAGRIQYGRCSMMLDNTDGRFCMRNPTGPYYGQLTRNTPIRVSVNGIVRFLGEVPEWPQRWDPSGRNIWVPIEAAGLLRRIEQGHRNIRSALYNSTINGIGIDVAGYWPMEDGASSISIASAVPGVSSITPAGNMNFAQDSTLPGSAPLPVPDAGAYLTARVPAFPSTWSKVTDSWAISWVMKLAAAPASTLAVMSFRCSSGPIRFGWVTISPAGTVLLQGFDVNGVEKLGDAGFGIGFPYGTWLAWQLYQNDDGSGNSIWSLRRDFVDIETGILNSASNTGILSGDYPEQPRTIDMNQAVASSSFGHLTAFSRFDVSDSYAAFGWSAVESAAFRTYRLCTLEDRATLSISNRYDETSEIMGVQQVDTFPALLHACEDTDQALLYEQRDALALKYRTKQELYNQYGPTISYTQPAFADIVPVDDDQLLWNDVTVQRVGGSTAHWSLDSGALSMSTQDPPNGVGIYDRGPFTVNTATDSQLDAIAQWIRHQGTWDEARYPQVEVNLANPAWVSNPTLAAQVAALDIGDAFQVQNLPAPQTTGVENLIQLQVRGYAERVNKFVRAIRFVTVPGWPWEVWPLETGGSALAVAASAGATSLKMYTTTGPPWSTSRVPYHQQCDGEALTVTAMTTATPAFIAAGTASHGDNANVTPGLPAGMTVDTGQILLVWACIRNTAATVNVPSGWTSINQYSNVRLLYKYYVTGDTAPTVTFSGGAAGDTTSAQIIGLSGVSHVTDFLQRQLNGVVQNIDYPAWNSRRTNNTQFIFAWKQDDDTGIAPPAGFTEAFDSTTVTGNDQSIACYYRIDTTATPTAAGTLTVTGGATAISRSVCLNLRPLQTATVTRAVNGVSKALAAGKAVTTWRLGVIAL